MRYEIKNLNYNSTFEVVKWTKIDENSDSGVVMAIFPYKNNDERNYNSEAAAEKLAQSFLNLIKK